jgi:hypothetical protein
LHHDPRVRNVNGFIFFIGPYDGAERPGKAPKKVVKMEGVIAFLDGPNAAVRMERTDPVSCGIHFA